MDGRARAAGAAIVATVLLGAPALAGPAPQARPQRAVDVTDTVRLNGEVHPLARPEFDVGRTDPATPMERAILVLQPPPERRAALERFLAEVQDPSSPAFHRWLTPDEFGARFGPADDDVAAVTGWLRSQGFVIDGIGRGGGWVNFTGTAADVERAFHAQIHDFLVGGQVRHANASDPEIPRALAGVIAGVVSLHDFPIEATHGPARALPPEALGPAATDAGGGHELTPGDFARIYNAFRLWDAGIDGSGQGIAVVGRSNITLADVQFFRSRFQLPANDPQVVINGPDPGVSADDELEADLDVEWAGAVAPKAAVTLVVSASTQTTDGAVLSAQYVVDHDVAPVMSVSFASCESALGAAGNAFIAALTAQAAAQGITVCVASGDSGAAACDAPAKTQGGGPAVSGLCSTPSEVCVGGTQFLDGAGGVYWYSFSENIGADARCYIPEAAWNESGSVAGGRGLWATGGGPSAVYAKPAWQAAAGVPDDGRRDLPDVALAAAGHTAYIVVQGHTATTTGFKAVMGTSASAPAFAGLMALAAQKSGARLGNANPRLYRLASDQLTGAGPSVFHDVTVGDNSVPGVPGTACGPGYDLATGLGAVDAAALVNNWEGNGIPDFSVTVSPPAITLTQGSTGSIALTVKPFGGFHDIIFTTIPGVDYIPETSDSDFGIGTSVFAISTRKSARPGTYWMVAILTGGSVEHSVPFLLTVLPAPGMPATVFADDFEGAFPGGWQLGYTQGAASVGWGKVACKTAGGAGAAWCATNGFGAPPPCTAYVPNMGAFLVHGPFSLADASAATVDFDTWYDTQPASPAGEQGDRLWWVVSTDGINFQGDSVSGASAGWVHRTLDLGAISRQGGIGSEQLWFGFLFASDATVNAQGAYVDNVVITKTLPDPPCQYALPAATQGFTTAGGSGTVRVAVTSGRECHWTVASGADWVTVTSGGNGAGSGTVAYEVAPNGGAPSRSTFLEIAGQRYPVYQAGGDPATMWAQWIPAVIHKDVPSLGARWRSDVAVVNYDGNPGIVKLVMHSTAGPLSTTFLLQGNEQVVVRDVVGGLGFSGDAGALEVRAEQDVRVTTRTYNQVDDTHTYGQDYYGWAPRLQAYAPGWLPGLIENARFRSNVGVANVGLNSASVTLTLFDGEGRQVWTDTRTYAPGELYQYQQPFRPFGGTDNGYARLTVAGESEAVVYASVIDMNTNDPTTVAMQADAGGGFPPYARWLPAVIHKDAPSKNARWRSDVAILNQSPSPANVTVTMHAPAGPRTRTIQLAGAGQAMLGDVAGWLGVTADSGALEVSCDQPFSLFGRTYNQVDDTHTYGQDYEGEDPSQALGIIYFRAIASLGMLVQNATYRTNIGVTNTSPYVANVTVALYDGDGSLSRTDSRDYQPGEFYQYQEPFAAVGGTENGYAKVIVNSGWGVTAYASVIDRNTGDPTTIRMQ